MTAVMEGEPAAFLLTVSREAVGFLPVYAVLPDPGSVTSPGKESVKNIYILS